MNLAPLSPNASVFSPGGVYLVHTTERQALLECAEQAGLLVVELAAPGPARRGRLALLIEESIENALGRRGALPPGIGALANLDASLSDQLYRARLVERRGLALSFGRLEGVAGAGGALDVEDSAVLRWWMAATGERPLCLFFDVEDGEIGLYGASEPLLSVLSRVAEHAESAGSAVPELDPGVCASAAAMELSAQPPDAYVDAELASVRSDLDLEDQLEDQMVRALADIGESFGRLPAHPSQLSLPFDEMAASHCPPQRAEEQSTAPEVTTSLHCLPDEGSALDQAWDEHAEASRSAPEATTQSDAEHAEATEHAESDAEHADATEHAEATKQIDTATAAPESAAPPAAIRAPLAAERKAVFTGPRAGEPWRTWLKELEAARGPKPLAVVERLFVSSYVPLRDAIARGLDDPRVRSVTSSWADSFAQSYSDAFDALRLRGKRPTMVLDVPDIALRIARLHGARSVQLIVVDAMRFDLGLRVQDRLRPLLGQRAALTERLLLWSALPANTTVQLELIGHGPKGLAELPDGCGSEVPVARGRSASTLRRIKAGHRELMKLDLVEAKLGEPGGPAAERLDALAIEVADVLHDHLVQLQPRTLAVVFGDHGFVLDELDRGTPAARHGGASPEEVLVPAFAWLVGNMH